MKIPKSLLVFVFTVWPIFAFSLVMLITGKVSLSLNGFGVDASGNLYIGNEKEITVYEGNKEQYTIDPHTSRSYMFTIQADNTILLSSGTQVYNMDLQGNILSEKEDTEYTYYEIQENKKRFQASSPSVAGIKYYFHYIS